MQLVAKKKIQGKKVPGALCKVAQKSTGAWCLDKIHMILVSVETQSCND
jgi:hypothetical protein